MQKSNLVIKRPLLAYAITEDEIASLQLPVYVSEKRDGIRGITSGDGILSRTLKPLPNLFLQKVFREFPAGIEGEIVCIDPYTGEDAPFETTESRVMSANRGMFTFWFYAFDYLNKSKFRPYNVRYELLQNLILKDHSHVQVIEQTLVHTHLDIELALRDALLKGREGICLRKPDGFYKWGRSTFNEQLFLKLKPWLDGEGIVVSFEPRYSNKNPKFKDERGLSKRSSHQANLQACNEVGAIWIRTEEFGTIKIGSGFSQQLARDMYANKGKYVDRTMTFRYRSLTEAGVPKHARYERWKLHAV